MACKKCGNQRKKLTSALQKAELMKALSITVEGVRMMRGNNKGKVVPYKPKGSK